MGLRRDIPGQPDDQVSSFWKALQTLCGIPEGGGSMRHFLDHPLEELTAPKGLSMRRGIFAEG